MALGYLDEKSTGQIRQIVSEEFSFLTRLCEEIRPLRDRQQRITPRRTTVVSIVATDGGSNQLRFDPLLFQIIRVVNSSNSRQYLEVVTPNIPLEVLEKRHIEEGRAKSPLGRMMSELQVHSLQNLSPMLKKLAGDSIRPPSWINVYRELHEWATLLEMVETQFPSENLLIVFDGLLRSKVFSGNLFSRLMEVIEEKVQKQKKNNHHVFVVGVAKRSKALDRYRLAMWLEGILRVNYPAYVEVPRDIEAQAYNWMEYARGSDMALEGVEDNKFVGGKMFFVKFGPSQYDPIWAVDIFEPQVGEASKILSYLQADAREGFPIPYYPASLQKAHENASLVGLDWEIIRDEIFDSLREVLGEKVGQLDLFRLQDKDPSQKRYR